MYTRTCIFNLFCQYYFFPFTNYYYYIVEFKKKVHLIFFIAINILYIFIFVPIRMVKAFILQLQSVFCVCLQQICIELRNIQIEFKIQFVSIKYARGQICVRCFAFVRAVRKSLTFSIGILGYFFIDGSGKCKVSECE